MTDYDIAALQNRWENEYRSLSRPWDTGVVPPEVRTFWHSGLDVPTSTAIDLGCGSGTNVAYLAKRTRTAIGIEISHTACVRARDRLRCSDTATNCQWQVIQADVTTLPLIGANAGYILDIGCMHSIPTNRYQLYAQGVIDNIAPGGWYHLYAHDRIDPLQSGQRQHSGISQKEVIELFNPQLSILSVLQGQPDPNMSHWYLMRKPVNGCF